MCEDWIQTESYSVLMPVCTTPAAVFLFNLRIFHFNIRLVKKKKKTQRQDLNLYGSALSLGKVHWVTCIWRGVWKSSDIVKHLIITLIAHEWLSLMGIHGCRLHSGPIYWPLSERVLLTLYLSKPMEPCPFTPTDHTLIRALPWYH